MEYRINRRTNDRISVLGMGSGAVASNGYEQGIELVRAAYNKDINFFDLAAADGRAFKIFGEALSDVRKEVMYQIHFGADYSDINRTIPTSQPDSSLVTYSVGDYGKTMSTERIKKSIDWQLNMLKTDYIDYGFVHCVDDVSGWNEYKNDGIFELLLDYKRQGIVKHIGLSSHTPSIAELAVHSGDIDMLMFSINAAYDNNYGEKYGTGTIDDRMRLYQSCCKEGAGISVMKPYAAGLLLDERKSFFGKAMNIFQCVQYCLDKPGVLTIVPGIENKEQLEEYVKFFDVPIEEKDYSMVAKLVPEHVNGRCDYCKHCEPCSIGISIGNVNKFYDLAILGDKMAIEHYSNLDHKAKECIQCGHCNESCPFGVDQISRMNRISDFFSRMISD